METIKQRMLRYLRDMQTGKGMDTQVGICLNINQRFGASPLNCAEFLAIPRIYKRLMDSWPKHSGHRIYPVPGVNGMSAIDTYHHYHNLWGNDEYGMLRKELLAHMISELEKEV